MEKVYTIKEVAEKLKVAYVTVYRHKEEWGFIQLENSNSWRIKQSALDQLLKGSNNEGRLALSVEEVKLCRSSNEKKMAPGGLILQHQTAKELDALLARL